MFQNFKFCLRNSVASRRVWDTLSHVRLRNRRRLNRMLLRFISRSICKPKIILVIVALHFALSSFLTWCLDNIVGTLIIQNLKQAYLVFFLRALSSSIVFFDTPCDVFTLCERLQTGTFFQNAVLHFDNSPLGRVKTSPFLGGELHVLTVVDHWYLHDGS